MTGVLYIWSEVFGLVVCFQVQGLSVFHSMLVLADWPFKGPQMAACISAFVPNTNFTHLLTEMCLHLHCRPQLYFRIWHRRVSLLLKSYFFLLCFSTGDNWIPGKCMKNHHSAFVLSSGRKTVVDVTTCVCHFQDVSAHAINVLNKNKNLCILPCLCFSTSREGLRQKLRFLWKGMCYNSQTKWQVARERFRYCCKVPAGT